MQRFLISILLVCISCLAIAQANPAPTVHLVAKGETLYSIARLYHIPLEDLEKANKSTLGEDYKLLIGQKITIPASSAPAPVVKVETTPPAPVTTPGNPNPQPAAATTSGPTIHIVQKGETGYAIAKATGVTWQQIKDANHLTDDTKLGLGQKLIIPSRNPEAIYTPVPKEAKPEPVTPKPVSVTKPTEQGKDYQSSQSPVIKTEPARQEAPTPAIVVQQKPAPAPVKAEEPKPNKQEEKPAHIQPTAPAKPVPAATRTEVIIPADYSVVFAKYITAGRKKVVYRGIGMFMPTENPGSQFVALYNYANKGSILKVTNLMSKQSIYARVMGRVPATDTQNDVILKVSSEAAEKLKVSEDKFLVEVTGYVKE